jgi:hypothetical protein
MGKTKQREAELIQAVETARARMAPVPPLVLDPNDAKEIEEAKQRFLDAQKKLREEQEVQG